MSRVKVIHRKDSLGDEAVASTNIKAGSFVVNEPPILVLPYQDVGMTTAVAKSHGASASAESSSSSSPAAGMSFLFSESQNNNSSSSSKLLMQQQQQEAKCEYESILLSALQKAEAIANKHQLSPIGYFAPIIMAHFTLSKEEIKDLFGWLISHAQVPPTTNNKNNNNKNNSSNVAVNDSVRLYSQSSLGPLYLAQREIIAANELLENFKCIFTLVQKQEKKETQMPTVDWWKNTLLVSNKNSSDAKAIKLLTFLHGVRINVHSDDVNKLTAVFRFACKMNHSCSANTFWYLTASTPTPEKICEKEKVSNNNNDTNNNEEENEEEEEQKQLKNNIILPNVRIILRKKIGNAVHVATRDIKQNEACTFSYVGCGLNMLSPTPQRRHSLSHLHFVCQCERCQSFDKGAKSELTSRALVCGECYAVAREKRDNSNNKNNSTELLDITQFLSLCQTPNNGWQCVRCGHHPGYEEVAESMFHETIHVDLVMSGFFTRKRSGSEMKDLVELWGIIKKVNKQLSSRHYISTVALVSFVSQFVGQVRQSIVVVNRKNNNSVTNSSESSSSSSSKNNNNNNFVEELNTKFEDYYSKTTKNKNLCFGDELVNLTLQSLGWFQNCQMKGTPQYVRFVAAIASLLKVFNNNNDSSSSGMNKLLSKKNLEMLTSLTSPITKTEEFENLLLFPDIMV